MQFQDSSPELQANPPQLPGEMDISGTALSRLRLSQLRDLARAFEIPVDLDAPKLTIMPAMMAAEQRGVFRVKPSRPYYYLRAGRSPDDPPLEHGDVFDEEGRYRDRVTETPPPEDQEPYADLQARVRELWPAFNVVGAKREVLEGIIAGAGA